MIRNFLSKIGDGVARPNRYLVYITAPEFMLTDPVRRTQVETIQNVTNPGVNIAPIPQRKPIQIDNARTLQLTCESTEMPGKQISTTEYSIYGPIYKNPYNQMYDQIPFVFLCTNDMIQKEFFDTWMEGIVSPDTNNIAHFYDQIKTDIIIDQLDQQNNPIYRVRLYEAYPVTVNPLPLDYSQNDSIHKLSVSFVYHYWKRENL